MKRIFSIVISLIVAGLSIYCMIKYIPLSIDYGKWLAESPENFNSVFKSFCFFFLPCALSLSSLVLVAIFLISLIKGSNILNFTRLTYEEYKELREKKKQEKQAKKRLQLEEKLKELQNVESKPKSTKG